MIYGTPNAHPTHDSTDLIGVRTLILRQYWTSATSNPNQLEIDAQTPEIPVVPGGVLLMGQQTLKGKGNYATYWTFQGINGNGKGVTFKSRGKSLDYGFEPGFSQLPIQQHPDFNTPDTGLLAEYEGYPSTDGTSVVWPAELSGTASNTSPLLLPEKKTTSGFNPMYGVQAYFEMEGVYRYRYAELSLPQGINSGVGRITVDIPGTPPPLEDGRNFLKAPPAWSIKGAIYDITEFFWLSRRGGWPDPVYGSGGVTSPISTFNS
jgi:hypothetical protein